MLVIPALWEAEAGGSLEPRSSRPAWATWRDPVSIFLSKKTKLKRKPRLAAHGPFQLFHDQASGQAQAKVGKKGVGTPRLTPLSAAQLELVTKVTDGRGPRLWCERLPSCLQKAEDTGSISPGMAQTPSRPLCPIFPRQNTTRGQARWLTLVIPTLWEAEAGVSPKVGSSRSAGPTWRNPVSTTNTKISRAWWHMSVTPATQEAEAQESLEPRRQWLQ